MTTAPTASLEIPTIPSLFVDQLLSVVEATDFDVPASACNREKVSVAEYAEIVARLHAHFDDEMIGMLARAVPVGSFATLCGMLAYSPTIETAMQDYARFYALFNADNQPLILVDAADDHFTISVNGDLPAIAKPYFAYSTLLGAVKLLSWLSGQRLSPRRLTLCVEPLGLDSEFAYLFGAAPEYGETTRAEYTAEIRSYKVAPLISADDYARHRTSHLLLWGVDDSIVRQVYALIAEQLAHDDLSSGHLAEQLHMSRQTLARRLQESGTSYSEVLERARKDKAIAMLRSTQLPLLNVAEAVGYRDTRSFSRAFKTWTGTAPGAYRKA